LIFLQDIHGNTIPAIRKEVSLLNKKKAKMNGFDVTAFVSDRQIVGQAARRNEQQTTTDRS
jgi:hypothetical protein